MDIVYFLLAVVVATPFLVYLGICNSLPENLKMTPLRDDEIPGTLHRIVAEYQSFGFQRAGPAMRVHLPQPPVIVPLVNRARGTMATVFEFTKPKVRRAYDVVTILEPGAIALTTGMDIGGGALPQPPQNFVQIMPGAGVRELLERHEQGLRFLDAESGGLRRTLPARIEDALRASFRRQRRHFDSTRISSTLTALWRGVTKSSPHRGPLVEQEQARKQIRKLRETMPAPRAPRREQV